MQMKLNERKFLEFSMGCDAGDVTACHSLGEWYSVMRSDYAKSIEIYRPNCETHKHAASCLNLGILLGTFAGATGCGRGGSDGRRRLADDSASSPTRVESPSFLRRAQRRGGVWTVRTRRR